MMRYPLALLFLLALSAPAALAQQPSDGLSDQQRLGRGFRLSRAALRHSAARPRRAHLRPRPAQGSNGGHDALMRKIIAGIRRGCRRSTFPAAQRDRRDHRVHENGFRHRRSPPHRQRRVKETTMTKLRTVLLVGAASLLFITGIRAVDQTLSGAITSAFRAEARGRHRLRQDGRSDRDDRRLHGRVGQLSLPAACRRQIPRLGAGARLRGDEAGRWSTSARRASTTSRCSRSPTPSGASGRCRVK